MKFIFGGSDGSGRYAILLEVMSLFPERLYHLVGYPEYEGFFRSMRAMQFWKGKLFCPPTFFTSSTEQPGTTHNSEPDQRPFFHSTVSHSLSNTAKRCEGQRTTAMASLPPRLKPWETTTSNGNGNANATASSSKMTASAFDNAVASTSGTGTAPKLPERPAGLDGTIATSGT